MASKDIKQNEGKGVKCVQEQEEWVNVAHTTELCATVNFALSGSVNDAALGTETVLDEKVFLDPSKKYKIRVAAVNSLGVGPWSEVGLVDGSTMLRPEFVRSVIVRKSDKVWGGLEITWEAPINVSEEGLKYTVAIAIRAETSGNELVFIEVYEGAAKYCAVSPSYLRCALIKRNTHGKPYITIQVSASNQTGPGRLVQLHWVQNK